MAEMTRELFLMGTKFKPEFIGSVYFNFKGEVGNGILCVSLTLSAESEYFANVSKVDEKGFNYYTYILPGKKKGMKARVSFSTLIAFTSQKEEVAND